MDLLFLHVMLLPKLPSIDLTECCIPNHGISIVISIASGQETYFTANEVWQWFSVHEMYWSYHVLNHLKTLDLIEL